MLRKRDMRAVRRDTYRAESNDFRTRLRALPVYKPCLQMVPIECDFVIVFYSILIKRVACNISEIAAA